MHANSMKNLNSCSMHRNTVFIPYKWNTRMISNDNYGVNLTWQTIMLVFLIISPFRSFNTKYYLKLQNSEIKYYHLNITYHSKKVQNNLYYFYKVHLEKYETLYIRSFENELWNQRIKKNFNGMTYKQ